MLHEVFQVRKGLPTSKSGSLVHVDILAVLYFCSEDRHCNQTATSLLLLDIMKLSLLFSQLVINIIFGC